MYICERCGAALPATASFCGVCGSSSHILQNGSDASGAQSGEVHLILPEDTADRDQPAQPLDEHTPPRSQEEQADEPDPPLDATPAAEAERDRVLDANEVTLPEHDDDATLAAAEPLVADNTPTFVAET